MKQVTIEQCEGGFVIKVLQTEYGQIMGQLSQNTKTYIAVDLDDLTKRLKEIFR